VDKFRFERGLMTFPSRPRSAVAGFPVTATPCFFSNDTCYLLFCPLAKKHGQVCGLLPLAGGRLTLKMRNETAQ
jgi:hypothetical protein